MAGKEGRVYNFSAGPSQMPVEVLESVQAEMLNYKGSGMSVMEMSHRSKEFEEIANNAEKNLRDILKVPDDYKICFFQGGATLQFASVPLNMLGNKTKADYLVTGQWGEKAHKEAAKYCVSQLACNTKASKFTTIPDANEWKLDSDAAYVHYCANETVNGVEFKSTPDVGDVPLVSDMSSNFMSKPIEVAKHAAIYAGLQKKCWASRNGSEHRAKRFCQWFTGTQDMSNLLQLESVCRCKVHEQHPSMLHHLCDG